MIARIRSMKNTISKAVSIIALATSISAIAPDHTLAKEKKQTGSSTKAASALISEVGFPAFKRRARPSSFTVPGEAVNFLRSRERAPASGKMQTGASTRASLNSSARSLSGVQSTINNRRQSLYGNVNNIDLWVGLHGSSSRRSLQSSNVIGSIGETYTMIRRSR